MLEYIEWYEILIRLGAAIIFGAVFGLEREMHGRPAGLRTHILVCLGSALVMLVSMYGFGLDSDPARLAAQVISGIGFLGAGAIMRERGNIKGITTAATLWISAMVGLSIGNGAYVAAGITTALALFVLVVLRHFEKVIGRRSYKMVIVVDGTEPRLKQLVEICDSHNITISNVEAKIIEYGSSNALQLSVSFTNIVKKSELESLFIEIQNQLQPLLIKTK